MRKRGYVDLGIRDEKVSHGDHIAFLWESPQEFEEAVGFLEVALRDQEHAVIFGHPEANGRVLQILNEKGHDTTALQQQGKLTILTGLPKGDDMLASVAAAFQRAVDRGAKLVRLLGNIGWGQEGWPEDSEILAFEAKVTEAAKSFPSVVLCLYDVKSLSGTAIVHGAFETHPITVRRNVLRENPHYVPIEKFLRKP